MHAAFHGFDMAQFLDASHEHKIFVQVGDANDDLTRLDMHEAW